MDSEAGADPEGRLADFREEDERCVYRSGSEETVDTVVAVSSAKKQQHTEAEIAITARTAAHRVSTLSRLGTLQIGPTLLAL